MLLLSWITKLGVNPQILTFESLALVANVLKSITAIELIGYLCSQFNVTFCTIEPFLVSAGTILFLSSRVLRVVSIAAAGVLMIGIFSKFKNFFSL